MIVISGALVLVALVLLVLGLTMTELQFVYGSIGISLVSFVFLVIGILQRRGEPTPASPAVSEGSGDVATGDDSAAAAPAGTLPQFVPAASSGPDARKAAPVKTGAAGSVPVVEDEVDDELEPGGGPVMVVEGRPRYHVDGCRYLNGRQAEELDVLDAREDGFTPCGVCKPDQVLEELYGELPLDDDDEVEPVEVDEEPAEDDDEVVDEDDVLDTGVPGAGDDEPERVPSRRGARAASSPATAVLRTSPAASSTPSRAAQPAKTTRAATSSKTTKAAQPGKAAQPAKQATAKTAQPAKKAPTKAAQPAKKATAKTAQKKPAAPAPVAAPSATGTPAKTAARTKVVVIPERDRFHVPSCRFVKGVPGTESLTRTQAGKQGFQSCGVCKP